jgi:hypothetical protein
MTLEEFQAKRKTYRQAQIVPGLAFLALYGVAGIATVFAARRIDQVGLDAICAVLLAGPYVIIALLMFCLLARIPRRRLFELGLICTKCGAQLNSGFNREVTATGRCRCGNQVLVLK